MDQIVSYFLGIKRPVEPITSQKLDQIVTSWVLNVPSTVLVQSSSRDKTHIQKSFATVQNTSHQHSYRVYNQTMCKPDYSQVTKSRVKNLVHSSGHITVVLRRFITGRCVNQTTSRSLNHEYIAGSHKWITVSGHTRVILRRFIIRRCVKRITARSLNPTSKSIAQKVYNPTMWKPGYSQVTKS